jgi:hypothetical protein
MRRPLRMGWALGAALLAGCGSGSTDAPRACEWQSSASSGGLCQSDYGCADGRHRAVNCAGDQCVCSTDDAPGVRFSAPGFCALDREARYPVFAAQCLAAPADAGPSADAH